MHTNTFAGRMGRWSAQHRKKAIWGWIAFVVIAFVIGNAVGTKKPTHDDYVGQSGQAEKLFADHFAKKDGEQVIVQAPKGGKATDAAVRTAVAHTIAAVSGKPGVTNVQSPYQKGNEGQVSKDGRSVLVQFDLKGDDGQDRRARQADDHRGRQGQGRQPQGLRRPVRRRQREQGARRAGRQGLLHKAAVALAADHAAHPPDHLRRARRRRHPAAARPHRRDRHARPRRRRQPDRPDGRAPSPRSSCSSAWPSASTTRSSTCVASARSARRGASKLEAIEIAAASSGRAVLVAGFTVMVAMAGMFFAGLSIFTALGIGAIMVVAVAMIGSVTVAARRAVVAGRSRREGPRAVPASPAPRRAARAASGAGSWARSSSARRSRPSSPPACSSRWRCRPSGCTPC